MIGQAMLDILTLPNFALKVGLMVMSAMFMGAILTETWRHLKIIMFIIFVFVVYQLWIHDTIIDNTNLIVILNHALVTTVNIIMSVVIMALWFVGMWLGIWIVTRTRQPYEIERLKMEAELIEIERHRPLSNLHDLIREEMKEPTHPMRRKADYVNDILAQEHKENDGIEEDKKL